MYSTTDKKDPEPTEYLTQINADYTRTCRYYRAITPERTVLDKAAERTLLKQRKMYENL